MGVGSKSASGLVQVPATIIRINHNRRHFITSEMQKSPRVRAFLGSAQWFAADANLIHNADLTHKLYTDQGHGACNPRILLA
jgi:hypothetical protein